MQIDVGSLVSQIQDLQKKNAELEAEKNVISSKVLFCLIFPPICAEYAVESIMIDRLFEFCDYYFVSASIQGG